MFKLALVAAAVAVSMGSFATPVRAAQNVVTVRVAPPEMRHEAMPSPRRGYDWTPGYWNWDRRHNRHQWVAGNWVRSRPGYVYAQPMWVERGNRWELRRGAWGRGDLDRDGVRNGRDRDRDGDGTVNSRDRAPNDPRRN